MTRRLRPPVPLWVTCGPDGRPTRLHRGGRARQVTHIAASWVQPALWWQDPACLDRDGLVAERCYYRVICDGTQVLEVFCANDRWYLERIID